MKQKLLLTQHQSPGDIVMLTCAIRDLHLQYPNEYETAVQTSCNDIFAHNPLVTKFEKIDKSVRVIQMNYPLIHGCNQHPGHFSTAFTQYLAEQLKRPIKCQSTHGDIYISDDERKTNPIGKPYWLVISGGKNDYTCKHLDPDRLQTVIDHFQGGIQFVQIGQSGKRGSLTHYQPRLQGVIDLIDKTTLRQMIHLMHHADGVICGVTAAMHLAAAVPTAAGKPKNRAAVIVAGGREPAHFIAYQHHQFLHTLGALSCCDNGGCWKSRVVPMNDGDNKDKSLCINPVTTPSGRVIPRCIDMISICDIIRAVEMYYDGGVLRYLDADKQSAAAA